MQRIYTLFALLFATAFLHAQIVEVPLTHNPVLQQQAKQEQEQSEKKWGKILSEINHQEKGNEICPLQDEGTAYISPGEALTIFIDTLGFDTLGGTLTCLNCADMQFGTATYAPVGDTAYVNYVANTGLEGASETIIIQFCENSPSRRCFNLRYPIVIKRQNGSFRPPAILFPPEQDTSFCLNISSLPGTFFCAQLIENDLRGGPCNDFYEGNSFAALANQCLYYRSTRHGGVDSVCVLLCDEFTVCDTVHLAFVIQQDTLSLPFMDDFSYDSPYPDARLWLDKGPYVNKTMAVNPPSIGVATFDGVDEKGLPYGNSNKLERLTSKYLNLSGKTAADNIYVSFWLQPKGLGDRPEVTDEIVLEFKNQNNQWIEIQSFPGIPDSVKFDSVFPFTFYAFPVNEAYLHSGFQFRFTSYSNPSGILDLWHLDYVRVSENEIPNGTFDDIAFSEPPASLLETYTSMPWRHFKGHESEELSKTLTASFFNHFPSTNVIANSNVQFTEQITGIPLIQNIDFVPFNFNLPAFAHTKRSFNFQTDFSDVWNNFLTNLTTQFSDRDSLQFITAYGINVPNELVVPGYEDIKRNNTVSRQTNFSNYFAYDDGTAESTIQLESFNNRAVELAVAFHTNVADTIRAIQIHFPRLTQNVSNQLFNMRIWKDNPNSEPVHEAVFQRPVYASDYLDTLQGFSTYPLVDELTGELKPLAVEANSTFYIGFEPISTCQAPNCIPFGYDLNDPQAYDFLYIKTDEEFKPLADLQAAGPRGAVMVRPVVGRYTPGPTAVKEVQQLSEFLTVYPNPSSGELFLKLKEGQPSDYAVQVFSSIGQLVQQQQGLPQQLNLQEYPNGIYFLKIINLPTQQSWNQKIVLAKY